MMKFLKKMTIGTAVLSVFYVTGCLISPHTLYSWRMWTDITGKILLVYMLPLLLGVGAAIWMWKHQKLHILIKGILTVAAAGVYLYLGFWAFLFIVFSTQEEKQLTKHLLVVNASDFLGASRYEYYEPVVFLLRRPQELTDEIKAEYLQEKYGVFVQEFSALDIRVSENGMALEDNFTECVTVYLAEKGIREQKIEREFYVSRNYNDVDSWLYLELDNREDVRDFSVNVSDLISYMQAQTTFFEEYRGVIGFYCVEGEEKITGTLPFGKLSHWDKLEADYYKNPETLAERITAEYEDRVRFLAEYKEQMQEVEKHISETEKTMAVVEKDHVENAAELIYKEVLAAEGYTYKVCYNAKGNLYLDLGTLPVDEDRNDAENHRYTLVYDRPSVNGNCELFVLYRESYSEDADGKQVLMNTVILDMYAVEIKENRVIASGRKNWEDLGTQEYREAIGE